MTFCSVMDWAWKFVVDAVRWTDKWTDPTMLFWRYGPEGFANNDTIYLLLIETWVTVITVYAS